MYPNQQKTAYFKRFCENNINFVIDLFNEHGKLKSWFAFKMGYNLNNISF